METLDSRSGTAAPLTLAEFAAALDAIGGFEHRPLLAVAVSGGPDSLALIRLAGRWARQHDGQVWGLTVDHGLRPESAAEARLVALWLARHGVPHEILNWTGDKPNSGLQEAARAARYRLLTEWCRRRGCLHLLVAHHRGDQVETHLIRRRARSGVDGLAGMSAIRELPGCRLVRPLLSVPRARLEALLASEGQPFLRDPSNRNPEFERARLRIEMADMPQPQVDEVFGEVRACGRQRVARETALDALIARSVALHPAGFAVLDRAGLAAADADTIERLLGRVTACIGGSPYPARRARLARLRAALASEGDRARTLGGCRFVPWRGRILVLRELAAASPPVQLAAGSQIAPGSYLMWDRRFAVALPQAAAGGLTLGYLGQYGLGNYGAAQPAREDWSIPRIARAALPALWDRQGLAAVPALGHWRRHVGELPFLSFCPAHPLTRAVFTVV